MIDYLDDYLPGIKVIENEKDYFNEIPKLWCDILRLTDQTQRKSKIIEIWNTIFDSEELSNTINFMASYLQEVHLISVDEQFSLIYVYKVEDERIYRQGKNSKAMSGTSEWNAELEKTSIKLNLFYNELHDGWFEPESQSMGLLSSADFSVIGDEDWGILDEIEVDVDLKKVVSVFSNGGGGYLCIDLNQHPVSAIIWWDDENPDLSVDLFDVLDEWLVIGFE